MTTGRMEVTNDPGYLKERAFQAEEEHMQRPGGGGDRVSHLRGTVRSPVQAEQNKGEIGADEGDEGREVMGQ